MRRNTMILIPYKACLAPIYHPMACLFLKLKNASPATTPLVEESMSLGPKWQPSASKYFIRNGAFHLETPGQDFHFWLNINLEKGAQLRGRAAHPSQRSCLRYSLETLCSPPCLNVFKSSLLWTVINCLTDCPEPFIIKKKSLYFMFVSTGCSDVFSLRSICKLNIKISKSKLTSYSKTGWRPIVCPAWGTPTSVVQMVCGHLGGLWKKKKTV